MSTFATARFERFTILNYFSRYWVQNPVPNTKCCFCKKCCSSVLMGKFYLLAYTFCTNYRCLFLPLREIPLFLSVTPVIAAAMAPENMTGAVHPAPQYCPSKNNAVIERSPMR